MRYRYDAVGVHLATLVDRDIFAGNETFIREVKPDLVRHIDAAVVVERPAATWPVNEMTVVVRPLQTQSRDPARLAMLSPERRIDPVVGVEWCDEDIADAGVAFGMTGLACKLDTNLSELCRKRCIQNRFGMCAFAYWYRSLSTGSRQYCRFDYFCSAAGAGVAAGFFKLLMMIVINGTISRGKIPFNGW